MRDCPDDAVKIPEDGHFEAISEFPKQLTELKHLVASFQNFRYCMYA